MDLIKQNNMRFKQKEKDKFKKKNDSLKAITNKLKNILSVM